MSETFGQALRRFRRTAGLSQPQLAKQAHVDQASLSRYENDRQKPSTTTINVLDELLGAGGELRLLGTGSTVHDVLTPDDRDRLDRVLERPHKLDGPAVETLAAILAAQRRADDTLEPTLLISATLAQVTMVTTLLKQATGPHRTALAEVAAEWVQFAGWLYAETRQDAEALRWLAKAEQAADEIGHGVLAAQAANFRGYVERQQGNWHGVTRWFLAEHHTPGASIHQRVGAAAQAAQGAGNLGDRDTARKLLDVADDLLDASAQHPAPRTAYWLSPTFHRLNLGLANISLGAYDVAADHLTTALEGLPTQLQGAAWTIEYRDALDRAKLAR